MLRIVLMGVASCGKTSMGEALSAALGIPYFEGDRLHPAANIEKMSGGVPLTDDDRWPWLDRVAATLAERAPAMVGCSALKRAYRDRIRAGAGGPVRFIHLAGSPDVIRDRMAARTDHFMPLSLLDSQFATLEPPGPDEALILDITQPVAALVETVLADLEGAAR